MLEVVFTFLLLVGINYIPNVWVSLILIILHIFFVLPGLYAMMFGAPFVPSSRERVKAILKMANVKSTDVVYDLGCGDGRLIREFTNAGVVKAVGYEFSIPTYFLARLKKWFSKNSGKIKYGNFWKKTFEDADVIACFLLDNSMKDFEKKIWPKLNRGVRVVSNSFRMPSVEPDLSKNGVHLYVKN